ncbi:MAG: carboxylesterase family protein [Gammaproteobacteria bacterium]|nr:carboxylesterase family protein [Gammaproteobacteria bacterium]
MTPRTATRNLLLLLLAALTACGGSDPLPPPSADPTSLRELEQGAIVGFADDAAHVWLGIPYAAAPVGDLRWRAPHPAPAWSGTREALSFGQVCPQIASPLGGAPEDLTGQLWGDEDCLFLNVYAPQRSAGASPGKLPVMVWIHGGGNTVGHSGFYNGAPLAAAHDVVVVTLNYRLGPLGWFLHPVLDDGDVLDASGNYGILDLQFALQWVQANIAAFGGDPERVTVFGESAGGTNIFALLVSPLSEGLLHGAIVQSGGTASSSAQRAMNPTDDPEAPGAPFSSSEILLRLLGNEQCDRHCALGQMQTTAATALASRLRDLDIAGLFDLYSDGEGLLGPASPTVIRDGHVLPERQFIDALDDPEAFLQVPMILGTNRDEPKIFMVFSPQHVVRFAGLPLWRRDARLYDLYAEYGALAWQLRGVTEPATRLRQAGLPVWAYRWDWDEQGRRFGIDLSGLLGAAHGLEIPFVFGHWDVGRLSGLLFHNGNAPGREALSGRMMAYWAGFARDLDPGRGADGQGPHWAPWNGGSGASFLHLDTEASGGIRMSREHLSHEQLIARLADDDRFRDDNERCSVFLASFRFGGDSRLSEDARRLSCALP